MNLPVRDQSKRRREIELLAATVEKTTVALRVARVSVLVLEDKLVSQRCELRLQQLLLNRAERAAALAAADAPAKP